MAYSFDGVNDHIIFGSDASVDGYTTLTISAWVFINSLAGIFDFFDKSAGSLAWSFRVNAAGTLRYQRGFTGTDGQWTSATAVTASTLRHIALSYDNTATTNKPTMYIDGLPVTVNTNSTPTGTADSDAANNLIMGEDSGNNNDYNGLAGFASFDNTIWTDADVNRAKWWGTRGGSQCYWPMLTDAVNRGPAVANGTVTGAVKGNIPRVERCWGSMMGVGR